MPSKSTNEQFISKAKQIHGEYYSYEKVIYIKSSEKIEIICPVHGSFWQTPNNHLSGNNCPKCAIKERSKKRTKSINIFIKQAIASHNNFYNYSNVIYRSSRTKIIITCPIHGDFTMTPDNHLRGRGCSKCRSDKLRDLFSYETEDFIAKAIEVHGNKYDYSDVEYFNNRVNVKIICPNHGSFKQNPTSHLKSYGCKYCSGFSVFNTNDFVKKAKSIHGNNYDYSNVDYEKQQKKVEIICKKHGAFWQTPNNHLNGKGCPKCKSIILRDTFRETTEQFIKNSQEIHGNIYDYSLAEYKGRHKKVQIICPVHGSFWQLANNHIKGSGCSQCNSSKGEEAILKILKQKQLSFQTQYIFPDCKYINSLRFDFAIFNENGDVTYLIEYNGKQHYYAIEWFGAEKGLEYQQKRDNEKLKYCEKNQIPLIIVKYNEDVDSIMREVLKRFE